MGRGYNTKATEQSGQPMRAGAGKQEPVVVEGYTPSKEFAKMLKAELKAIFPDTRFSIRTKGSHLWVSWIGGASKNEVRPVAGRYEIYGNSSILDSDAKSALRIMHGIEEIKPPMEIAGKFYDEGRPATVSLNRDSH